MEKKLHILLIVQDFWQDHYEIFPIIVLKEFIKLYVNKDTMIKNVKLTELNISIATVLIEYKCFCCNEN